MLSMYSMKRYILFIVGLLSSMQVIAQTGIGTTTPHASAKLDVSANNKGFLPPRVTLTSATDISTIPSPAEGLLVYNLGSVGLQAGYYFWNGANWTTIATGTTAGNAVIAGDLVKLYHETYSTTAGKASSSTGYSFTVPVSGRYEFNFNCTGWNSNGSLVKLTFNIREGTNVIGTDYHQSASSNAWVEYEGRFEVNLIAGVTYNAQVVTSTGRRDNGYDWDKIMYKMVAGNLPVNQHMAAQNVQLNNNFLSNDGGNEGIRIDNAGNVGIGTSAPTEKLEVNGNVKANNFIGTASTRVLYLLEAYASVTYTLPGSYTNDICRYSIVNNTVNVSSSWFNTSNYRFTPQKGGYWEITASYDVYRNSESSVIIQKNGTNVAVSGTISSVVQQLTKIVYLNGSTDYITIANSGFNSNARSQTSSSSWFQARWIGE
jgi:hypothetical protein